MWPFEICRVKMILEDVNSILKFVDDDSCSAILLKSIDQCIQTVEINKFSNKENEINEFFDLCKARLGEKKTNLKGRMHIGIPNWLAIKLVDVESFVELGNGLRTQDDVRGYLNNLNRVELLSLLTLYYYGHKDFDIVVPNNEFISRCEEEEARKEITNRVILNELLSNKVMELDKTFEKDEFIIRQIMQKAELKKYLKVGINKLQQA